MSRVLMVSHVFPPLVAGGAPRMGQFARLLPEVGWEVTVLTARHGQSTSVDRIEADAIASRAQIIETWSPTSAVSRRGKPAAKHGLKGTIRRAARTIVHTLAFPDRELLWVPSALRAARRALRSSRHDVVFASYGPASNLLLGWQLAREFELPLVVDFRDLWSTLPMTSAFVSPAHRALARRLERMIVHAASRVIAVAPKMAESLAATHSLEPMTTFSVTNGFDPDDFSRVHDGRTTQARPFRLMYTGSVHAHYDFTPVWKALRSLLDAGAISPMTFRIEFVGNLGLDEAREHGVAELVDTAPFVPRAQVFDELARADALLVVETPGYYAEFGYAAKVFDYLLTGKPVVAIVDAGGNTARLLGAAGVAITVRNREPVAVRNAIEAALARKHVPPRRVDIDAEPLRSFNRRHLVSRLGRLLDDVIATEPHGRWRA
jgi:glycosyltransferase involved in cell wall biosynthesis